MTNTVIDLLDHLRKSQGAAAPAVPEIPAPVAIKELEPDMAQVIEAFAAAKELLKFADEQKTLLEVQIREALDGATIGTIAGKPVIKVNSSHNTHLKAEVVRDGWPEAYAAALKRTDYTFLSIQR